MKKNPDQFLEDIISNFKLIDKEDIPNIDLYMDQVTNFMDKHLKYSKRYEDDKILTKTMINNYAKNDLIPSPEKKKYTKEHIIILTFIYYFKTVMSINDSKTVLHELTEKYFKQTNEVSIEKIYEEICRLQQNDLNFIKENIEHTIRVSNASFESTPKSDQDFLQRFALICLLSFDVYAKKQMIEKIIDSMTPPMPNPKPQKPKQQKQKPDK